MPSVNLDLNFYLQPRTLKLVDMLGKDSENVALRLRCYCGEHHSEDGRLTGLSAAMIESISCWRGKKGAAIAALLESKFLSLDGDTYVFHDFEVWGGHIKKYRERARTAALAKAEKDRLAKAEKDRVPATSKTKAPSASSLLQADPKDASISCSISSNKDLTTKPPASAPKTGLEQQCSEATWKGINVVCRALRARGWREAKVSTLARWMIRTLPHADEEALIRLLARCLDAEKTVSPDLSVMAWYKNRPSDMPSDDNQRFAKSQFFAGDAELNGASTSRRGDVDALINSIFRFAEAQ